MKEITPIVSERVGGGCDTALECWVSVAFAASLWFTRAPAIHLASRGALATVVQGAVLVAVVVLS